MANSKAEVTHVKIRDIGPSNDSLLLRGVIIRKQEARMVRIRRDNSEKCVWSFTLRDSPCDLINVNAWGSGEFIKNLCSKFKIGDIVDVMNVSSTFRKMSDQDDVYQPSVTSSFFVTFNEIQSNMYMTSEDVAQYLPLLNIPTKPPGNFFTISDVLANETKLIGQFVNLLAAVRELSAKREFQTKDGRHCECKDVTLTDQSFKTITVTLWGIDLLALSENWIPKSTILFFADVRVERNEFRGVVALKTTGKTIVTENPTILKAQNLKDFLNSTPYQASGKLDQIISKYTDPYVITNVMSCAGVISKGNEPKSNTEYSALVYALLNCFDIDRSTSEDFVVTKCMRCNWTVDRALDVCLNSNCTAGSANDIAGIDQVYDIRVSLMDHTGLLTNCRITNSVAVKLIGLKASLFDSLEDEEKTNIKWKYLLKYFAARIVALPLRDNRMPIITILSLDLISLAEYSSLVPMY